MRHMKIALVLIVVVFMFYVCYIVSGKNTLLAKNILAINRLLKLFVVKDMKLCFDHFVYHFSA